MSQMVNFTEKYGYQMLNRLSFILILVLLFQGCADNTKEDSDQHSGWLTWDYADSISDRIQLPVITGDEYSVLDFGALPDMEVNSGPAIQDAIDAAYLAGGGTVRIPEGTYSTGPIVLKSNIHLHLDRGTTLQFIDDPALYPNQLVWYRGIPCYNYSPFIYAHQAENIKISGSGIIDGNGSSQVWVNMKQKEANDWDLLHEYYEENVSVKHRKFGKNYNLRPDLIGFMACNTIQISDIKIINTPMYGIHAMLSSNVSVDNIQIQSKGYDQVAIIPESTELMRIRDSEFRDVDKGIEILSGREKNKDYPSSHDILIESCRFFGIQENAIGIGPDIKAGVNKVFIRDVHVNEAKKAFAIRTDSYRGGDVHSIYIKNGKTRHIYNDVIYVNVFHGANRRETADFGYFEFDSLIADSVGRAFYIEGSRDKLIHHVRLLNSDYKTFKRPLGEDLQQFHLSNVTLNGTHYTGTYKVGDIKFIGFEDNERNDQQILDVDDLSLSELPARVQDVVQNYGTLPIERINRKITKTGVYYEIRFTMPDDRRNNLLVHDDGSTMRVEKELLLHQVPTVVRQKFHENVTAPFIAEVIDDVVKVTMSDIIFYQIEGEYLDIIFKLDITNEGIMLEKKEHTLNYGFPTEAVSQQ